MICLCNHKEEIRQLKDHIRQLKIQLALKRYSDIPDDVKKHDSIITNHDGSIGIKILDELNEELSKLGIGDIRIFVYY